MKSYSAVAGLILLTQAPLVLAANVCEQIRNASVEVATARDAGFPENKVAARASGLFPDPAIKDAVSAIVHTIYTGPALRRMAPGQVGDVVQAMCTTQVNGQ